MQSKNTGGLMDTSKRLLTNRQLAEAALYLEAWLLMEVPGSEADKALQIAVECIYREIERNARR